MHTIVVITTFTQKKDLTLETQHERMRGSETKVRVLCEYVRSILAQVSEQRVQTLLSHTHPLHKPNKAESFLS